MMSAQHWYISFWVVMGLLFELPILALLYLIYRKL